MKHMPFSELNQRALTAAPDPERIDDSRRLHLTARKPVRFLRLPEVLSISGLSKSSIYDRISQGNFPAPVPLGGRAVGWIEEEVVQWVYDRIAQARTKTPQRQLTAA